MTAEHEVIRTALEEKEAALDAQEQEFAGLRESLNADTQEDRLMPEPKGKLRDKTWWMTALQQRVKTILTQQLDKAEIDLAEAQSEVVE